MDSICRPGSSLSAAGAQQPLQDGSNEANPEQEIDEEVVSTINTDQGGPFISITFENNETYCCLLDTGSNFNIVSENLLTNIDMNELSNTKTDLRSITGNKLKVKGLLNLRVTICNITEELTFVVLEESDVLLLGMSGMEDLNIVIDVKKQMFGVASH